MNVGKPIDFSACAFGADERKPVGQVWLLDERNLDPTVGASHGGIGLGGDHEMTRACPDAAAGTTASILLALQSETRVSASPRVAANRARKSAYI